MKKTALFAAAAALLLFGACQKDGKYNPKQKIAKVYEESNYSYYYYNEYTGEWNTATDNTPKHLTEEWTWDGKKLSKITHIDYDYDEDEYYEEDEPLSSGRVKWAWIFLFLALGILIGVLAEAFGITLVEASVESEGQLLAEGEMKIALKNEDKG